MSKIKILQFPIANSNGGITHYALSNWQWMNKDAFQCDFATMSKRLDFDDEIRATGSKIFYISCYAEENEKQFRKEVREILANGYDVVHLHTKRWKSFVMEELCIEYGIPKIIVHSHSTGIDTMDSEKREFETKLHNKTKKMFNTSLATDFWACSHLSADFLFGGQIPENRIKIMHNAIDINKFVFNEESRNQYRKRYNLEDYFVLGNVARFAYPKNHEFLIDVFAQVEKEIPDVRLVLLGDGELRRDIENKVKKLNIASKVLFLGNRTDVNHWYQAMDVFCFPSEFEGLPIALVEAQAAGLPCIMSEAITEEALIANNICHLPLSFELWKEKIVESRDFARKDNTMELKKKGYDIQTQIKCIEKEYCLLKNTEGR